MPPTTDDTLLELQDLRDFYECASVGFHTLDHEGRYLRLNLTEARWLGVDRVSLLRDRPRFVDFLDASCRAPFEAGFAKLAQGEPLEDLELEMCRTDGSCFTVLLSASATLDAQKRLRVARMTLVDISQRRRDERSKQQAYAEVDRRIAERTAELALRNEDLRHEVAQRELVQSQLRTSEAQLLHAQKMEAVGRLAGGVAHDFNNMLSVIMSFTDVLLEDGQDAEERRADLLEIRGAAQRAADLSRSLLAFSRQQVMVAKTFDVNDLLRGITKMLRRLIGEDVELVVSLEPLPGMVCADPGQIEQVVVNLVVNARDALTTNGRITVESALVELDGDYAEAHFGMKAGPHVMIAVSDNGIGMDKGTLERVFDPFFTTKEAGRGTGLGLSTVYGIVKQSGGHVWTYSEVGRGTVMKVYLPRVGGEATISSNSGAPQSRARPSEQVLVVEDENMVRRATRRMLERRGFTVYDAPSGDAALEMLADGLEVDVLLTDVVMPRMSGVTLAEKVHEKYPHLPIVYMSGYTDVEVVGQKVLEPGALFVQKPLSLDVLLSALRRAIDRAIDRAAGAPPSSW